MDMCNWLIEYWDGSRRLILAENGDEAMEIAGNRQDIASCRAYNYPAKLGT